MQPLPSLPTPRARRSVLQGGGLTAALVVACALLATPSRGGAPVPTAEFPRACAAGRLPVEPEMDGLITDDPAWQPATVSDAPFALLGSSQRPPRATRFHIGYTPRGIAIAILCDEPQMARIQADKPDMDALWGDDSVELFLQPVAGGESLHLVVNAIGSRYNAPYRGRSGLLAWSAAAFLDEQAWSAEIFVPYETLGVLPDSTNAWRLNVCRTIRTVGADAIYSTWAPCRSQFDEPERFGTLTFDGAGLTAVERDAAAQRLATAARERAAIGARFALVRPDAGLLVTGDGAPDAPLVRLNGAHVAPRLLPDGQRLLYHSLRGGTSGVWSVALDDRVERRLCDGEQASVTPDGRAFLCLRNNAIVEHRLDDGRERLLVAPPATGRLSFPAALPGGGFLYLRDGRDLRLARTAEGAHETLLSGELLSAPRPSPDGRWVAYQDGAHLWLAALDTGARRQLTHAGGVQSWPIWSADSRSLCFCQAGEPQSTLFDLYRLNLDQPEKLELLLTRTEAAPDWSGAAPKAIRAFSLNGGAPRASVDTATGDWLLDSPWACLKLSTTAGRIVFLVKETNAPAEVATLAVEGPDGQPARGPLALAWGRRTEERLEVVADFTARDGTPVRATFALPPTRPAVTVTPLTNALALQVRAPLSLLLSLDRLANDLPFAPAGISPETLLRLPDTALTFGFDTATPARMLLFVTSSTNQHLSAWSEGAAAPPRFAGCRIGLAGAPAHLAALAVAVANPAPAWQRAAETGVWQSAWSAFPGKWRVALRSEERLWTTMLNAPSTGLLTLPLPSNAPPPSAHSVIYLFDRNAQTAPSVLTPLDLLRDLLGVAATDQRLDTVGVRSCHDAAPDIPFKDYRVPLRIAQWIDPGGPGALRSLKNFCGDLARMLCGVEARLKSYRAAGDELAARTAAAPLPAALREALQTRLHDVRAPDAPATSIAPLLEAVAQIQAAERHDPQQVRELVALAERLFAERIARLTACRAALKDCRDLCGLAIAVQPEAAGPLETLRQRVGAVLRFRDYAEDDWRGETPLNPESVDYEKLDKLP